MILLIADDDRLIRFMMKSMLTEILISDYIILEAANGKEMVEICKKRQPDLVFTDIKMPYVNGLDAIMECKLYSDKTEFVVISGYSEFSYAQNALKLGVTDYLLKPVDEEQLSLVVDRVRKKIAGQKKESNARFQLKLFNMFNYFATVGTKEEYEETCEKGIRYEAIGMKSRCLKENRELNTEFQKEMIDSMNEFGKIRISCGDYYSQIYSAEGTPYFVFCTTQEGREKLLSFVKKLSLKNQNNELAYYFFSFSGDNMKDIFCTCEKIDSSQGTEMNYPVGSVIDVSEIDISKEGRDVLKNVYQLLAVWENADSVHYKEILNNMYRKYKDTRIGLNLEYVSKYCSLVMQQDISCDSYKEFCRSFVEISESMYDNVESTDSDIIGKIKTYVENYYMNDISIGQIAEAFNITPNYLSRIFHEKAGCKFVDYLTDVRISNAKKLLISKQNVSAKDIAVMVGYNSPRYFATLFQKSTGTTPTAYRKENTA